MEKYRAQNGGVKPWAHGSPNTGQSGFDALQAQCLTSGVLYDDPDFPANDLSLYLHRRPVKGPIVWRRPYEMSKNPKLYVDGTSRFDVVQGALGDCWLVAGFACLTLTPCLLRNCIPKDQGFGDKYAGIFHFRFWRFGDWVDVIVDDRLPTYRGQLLYLRSPDPDEFWSALMEKAFAKFYGNYETIHGGYAGWALQDLTGGISESIRISDNRDTIMDVMQTCVSKSTVIAAHISTAFTGGELRRMESGLVSGHSYSVTGMAMIQVSNRSVILVRLRNPWGAVEWRGAWGDNSPLWQTVDDDVKQRIQFHKRSDGEFWMSYGDFVSVFSHLEVCHLTPECWCLEPALHSRTQWHAVVATRQWRRGFNAGGGPNSGMMWVNPQFYLAIDRESYVIMSLLQKHTRYHDNGFIPTACWVYKAPRDRLERLPQSFFMQHSPVGSTDIRSDRDNVCTFHLPVGSYVIVPSTMQPNMEAKFMLRLLAENPLRCRELEDVDQWHNVIVTLNVSESEEWNYRRRFYQKANKDGEIDASQLHAILSYTRRTSGCLECISQTDDVEEDTVLSEDSCRAALGFMDRDLSGRLRYEEFRRLMDYCRIWKKIFEEHASRSGKMDTYNLHQALKKAGFTLSNRVLEAAVLRFSSSGQMSFDGLFCLIVRLHAGHQQMVVISYRGPEDRKKKSRELLLGAIYS